MMQYDAICVTKYDAICYNTRPRDRPHARAEQAADPTKSAEIAAVVMDEGAAVNVEERKGK